jgi:transposase-like protein
MIALIVNAKKGISSCQVSRDIGVRQGTVWKIMHKIREILGTKDGELLKGLVFEMDETYVKTNKNNKHNDDIDDDLPDDWDGSGKPLKRGRGSQNNTAIVGIKEKNGNVKAIVTDNVRYATLIEFAKNNIAIDSEIHTDEFKSYKRFGKFFNHKTVNHSREYVSSKNITTNGIEGFWSLLKRGIKGQFHRISKFYLQKYIDEFCYRYNMRFVDEAYIFDDIVRRLLLAR